MLELRDMLGPFASIGKRASRDTPIAIRLAKYIDYPGNEVACWLWMAALTSAGYGQLVDGRRLHLVHRLVYEYIVGPIPPGLTLDHLCRNRACCNPSHLEPVTHRVNILRGEGLAALNLRKTHCLNGHELSQQNVYVYAGRPNERLCRLCRNRRSRESRARRCA